MNMELRYTEMNPEKFGLTVEVKGVLYKNTSKFQTVEIIDTEAFGKMLLLDGLVMTTERDEFFYHEMIAHIPMLSHPNPKHVLVIGGGDGGTVREVLKHDCVESVVLCEIDGLVIDVCKQYLPTIASKLNDEKVSIEVRDGIEYIAKNKNKFDIILIDSTDPMGPGEGLFTEEFYKNVNAALKEGGIMVAQSESPFANQKEIKKIYPLLRKAFPIVRAYAGSVPTYPGGYWSWAFCSESYGSLSYIDDFRAEIIEKDAKLYNRQIHRGAFILPNFVKELVGEKC